MAATITLLNALNSPAANVPLPAPFAILGRRPNDSNSGDQAEDSCSSSRRRKRSAGEHNNLVTVFYSVCCLYQFARYLPLLILRVCFGASPSQPKHLRHHHHHCQQQQQQQQQDQPPPQDNEPGVRTLTGLLLLGLPLMLLSGLPIVGRLVAASPSNSPSSRASSRSRASSISSISGPARGRAYTSSMSSVDSN